MRREVTEPTLNEHGDEAHPSFGLVRVNRVTATPPYRLFDSSVPHTEFVRLEISRAHRKRELHRDCIFAENRTLVEISMSLSQWGALVSSFGHGEGTPVTLTRVDGKAMPEAAHESRLAQTSREVADAARKSTEDVQAAVKAVEDAFERKAGRRELGDLLSTLYHTAGNLPANMKFAADTLTRHAEDVVAKAKVDIEAARQFGTAIEMRPNPLLEIEGD